MRRRLQTATLALLLAFTHASGAVQVSEPFTFSSEYDNGTVYMKVRLHGAVRINKTAVDGRAARELSGLAWDEDEQVLYALSDDGFLAHLRPRIDNGMLTGVDYLAAFALREDDGTPVRGDAADSEGLAIRGARNDRSGDTELFVSFEVEPRVRRYDPRGRPLGDVALPPPLGDIGAYAGSNKALEALALHPRYGLLTAPQRPLQGEPGDRIPIFAMDGRRWLYEPLDPAHSAIVGLEVAPRDGRLLVLERRFANIFRPVVFSIRRLDPDDPAAAPVDVARFDSTGPWRLDNFESIAHHREGYYFLVSDDNESAIQRTILVYLEIVD